jgi:hypothetical protein
MNRTPIPKNLTVEEKNLLATIARLSGQDFIEKHWRLILKQARALGESD